MPQQACAAPGRGVMDTGIPATPARRCENAGRWGCRTGWTTGVLGYLPFPRHDFRTILTFVTRMSQMVRGSMMYGVSWCTRGHAARRAAWKSAWRRGPRH